MNFSIGFLTACAALTALQAPKIIENSTSPNGNYHLVAETKSDFVYYYVATKNGTPVSEELESDFGALRSQDEASSETSVSWHPDNAYVVLFTGHDRHHVDFLILARTGETFKPLPFDWEKLVKFLHRKPLGFGYPAFLRWRPDNQIEVDLFESDGINTSRESSFVLNLADNLKPVSWKILKPERKHD